MMMVIDKRIPRIHWIILIFLGVAKSYNVVRRDPYAIISETIVTRQRASCDGDILQLSCPSGTKISIQLVLYGRSAPSSELCEPTSNLPRIYTGFEGLSCTIREALRTVEELCQSKQSCSILTSPTSFGVDQFDNCPGIRKYIEVVYKCHPTKFSQRNICGGTSLDISCDNPDHGIAILSGKFHHVGSGPVYCPIRQDFINSARQFSEEETAASIKECERSKVTQKLIKMCHGSETCEISADPEALNAPKCNKLHVALKVAYACMTKENFLPVYVQTGEEKEKNHSVKNSNYLESSIPRSQEKTKNIPSRERRPFIGVNKPEFDAIDKNGAVEQEMTSADNPHYDTSTINSEADLHLEQTKSLTTNSDSEQSSWLLKIIYSIVRGVKLIINFVKDDQWKLVIVLTLTTGFGVTVFLLVIIFKLCLMYSERVTKPRDENEKESPIDLDSDTVDYDINSQLYTPLPEPKIMQISQDASDQQTPFNFSTLTRNKSRNTSKVSPSVENYLGADSGKDKDTRYSTIGRSSQRNNFVRNEFANDYHGPRSLNTSYENNHLYY